jgi:hypothetical protein
MNSAKKKKKKFTMFSPYMIDVLVLEMRMLHLLSDLQITQSSVPTIWCDNFSATYLSIKLLICDTRFKYLPSKKFGY